jgi:hypothetical protein
LRLKFYLQAAQLAVKANGAWQSLSSTPVPRDVDRLIWGGYGAYRERASNIQYALLIRVRPNSRIGDRVADLISGQ